jgi:hypothetical protein
MPECVAPASQPGMAQAPVVPLLEADPCDPPVGTIWVNMPDGKLKVRWPQETYSFQLLRDDGGDGDDAFQDRRVPVVRV